MNIPVKKNEKYIVNIIDNGFEGEGIAKIDNYTIFIPQAIIGEKCEVLILKVNKSYAYGKIINIIEESKERRNTDCDTYKRCGGCNLRHIDYEYTLKMKQKKVQNLVNKTLDNKIEVKDTIGMNNPYNYRNKAQFPIGYDKNGKVITGIYAERTHEIIEMSNCKIQNEISEKIAKIVTDFLNENKISAYDEKNLKRNF